MYWRDCNEHSFRRVSSYNNQWIKDVEMRKVLLLALVAPFCLFAKERRISPNEIDHIALHHSKQGDEANIDFEPFGWIFIRGN